MAVSDGNRTRPPAVNLFDSKTITTMCTICSFPGETDALSRHPLPLPGHRGPPIFPNQISVRLKQLIN